MCFNTLLFSNRRSDLQVNFSAGRYFSVSNGEIAGKLPFDAGFEVWSNLKFSFNTISMLGGYIVDEFSDLLNCPLNKC